MGKESAFHQTALAAIEPLKHGPPATLSPPQALDLLQLATLAYAEAYDSAANKEAFLRAHRPSLIRMAGWLIGLATGAPGPATHVATPPVRLTLHRLESTAAASGKSPRPPHPPSPRRDRRA